MTTTEPRVSEEGRRWRSRPVLSAFVRAVAIAAPAALAFVFAIAAARVVPAPPSPWPRVVWWLSITVVSVGVLIATQRVARRLLPLAALLKLSLLFPDHAPQRYKLARKVGRPKDLELQLRRARQAGQPGAEILGPQSVLELVAALSVHDRATRGHSERVRIFTDLIGAELKLPQHDQDRLRWAALLHDVGKLKVPAAILRKPGRPTAIEWVALKAHPTHGSELIAPIAPWLGQWALAVEHHHERYDGAGYPHGLHGEQISLGGRIVAVADSYETMTAARPYKRPISPGAARNELVACSGAQFDPAVVRAFLNISLGRLWKTIGAGAWLSQIPLLPQVTSGLGTAGSQVAPLAARGALGLALVTGASVAAPSQSAASGPSAPATQRAGGAPSHHGRIQRAPRGQHGVTVSEPAPPPPAHPGPPPKPAPVPKSGPPTAGPPPPPPKPPKPAKPPKGDKPDKSDKGPKASHDS
jgi:HD-GYP domain-containing protein (c-di-GMP phosphodiesterase class II)